ncbi:dysbindin-like [Asterias rubens]|uniref:dysbindin-like n=1 Tax=Asterias rubens TaxID=7604 RepID=UPI0014550E6A|nr:dysbindin-like [Asterias rubens]
MFDQLRQKFHHVQQDLSAGLKTLSTRAKEVKIPRREELSALKKDNRPAVPQVCNHDAGAELLDRYQRIWSELHQEIEASAEEASVIDLHIQQVFLNYERRAEPIVQFQKQLQDLPRVVENIQYLTASIGKLEGEFEEMESMLSGFQDLIDHCELLRNKQTQTAELARYTQQKMKEEELMKGRLQEEYEQSVRLKEESQKAGKMERQKAFQDVFAADMDHYRTHGEMQRVVSDGHRTPTDISSIENFEISVDDQEQEALDDFLGGSAPGATGKGEEAGDDGEEEDDGEMEILEVIKEETEQDETGESSGSLDKGKAEEDAHSEDAPSQDPPHEKPTVNDAEEDAQPEVAPSQETTQEKPTVNDEEEASETTHDTTQEDEEDDEDEFDTPDEGSEKE